MANKETLSFLSAGSAQQFPLTLWLPQGPIKGVVQILHGMAEHIDRYDLTARELCDAGYAVAGHNHKGHGEDAKKNTAGYFYDNDGWGKCVKNAHQATLVIKNRLPNAPFVLLGHSMGSFMAREYVLRYPGEPDALVLSGTGCQPAALCAFAKSIAALSPQKKPAKLVDSLAFSGNNKPFAPARTPFDWLSRDEQEVDKYIADDLCGFTFTGGAFKDFFGGLMRLNDKKRLAKLQKTLPVYFMSGNCDPVGAMGKGVLKAAKIYENAGLTDVTVKLYDGARHELFNEINRDEVIDDLIAWLDQKVRK